MSRCESERVLSDHDWEVLDKCYWYVVRECESPLYAFRILRLGRERLICEQNRRSCRDRRDEKARKGYSRRG
ncbi:hypothetical protein ES705_39280 [subsurface metagenome]